MDIDRAAEVSAPAVRGRSSRSDSEHPPIQLRAPWNKRGPSTCNVASATNSWFYVLWLQAAVEGLASEALASWRAEPRADPQWEGSRGLLAASAPVPFATLPDALIATAPSCTTAGQEECLPLGGVALAVGLDRSSDAFCPPPIPSAPKLPMPQLQLQLRWRVADTCERSGSVWQALHAVPAKEPAAGCRLMPKQLYPRPSK